MTADEKRKELREYCAGKNCNYCRLSAACFGGGHHPVYNPDTSNYEISKIYSEFEKLKGDKTMEERTITITTHEYKGLVADQAILAKLEVYTETHEYLSDDVIRALLGVEKPNIARIESEGD